MPNIPNILIEILRTEAPEKENIELNFIDLKLCNGNPCDQGVSFRLEKNFVPTYQANELILILLHC